MPYERDKLIRFHHCDPAGIVFYPQYFVLMNELVEDWFDDGLGHPFSTFHGAERLGLPMAHLECDFFAPSRVGDRLKFRLEVEKIGNSSMTLAVTASHGGIVRIRARLVVVLDVDRHRQAGADRGRVARALRAVSGAVSGVIRRGRGASSARPPRCARRPGVPRSPHSRNGIRTISCTRVRARTRMKRRAAERCTIPPRQRCRRQHISK